MQIPSVAIIVLNFNGLQDTLDCLDSLSKIDYPNYEIFVLDNGSSQDESKQIPAKYHVLRSNENLGFTGGNNLILRLIKFDYMLLLNNDTVVDSKFLNCLVESAEMYPDVGLLSGLIYCYDVPLQPMLYDDGSQGPNAIWYNGADYNKWTGASKHKQDYSLINPFYTGYITGCCMLIKRQVLLDVGLLDNNYFAYCEDLDYCVRASKKEWKCLVDQRAVIYHKVSQSTKKSNDFGYFYYLRNRLMFMKKNSDVKHLMVFYPYYLMARVVPCFIHSLITGNIKRVLLTYRAIREGLE